MMRMSAEGPAQERRWGGPNRRMFAALRWPSWSSVGRLVKRVAEIYRSPSRKAVLIVGALSLMVFLPAVATGFVYDDRPLIVENEYVHAWRWFFRGFGTHLWDVSRVADATEPRRYYRPLVTVSYLVTWMLVGARPWVFHLTNVMIHAGTACLATRAALRWTRSAFCAVAIGLVFALHPSRTENVTWISGRTDLLMMLFIFGALEAFARFERLRTSSSRAALAFGAGIACVVAAILSKEPAAMFPLLLLVENAARRSRTTRLPSNLPLVATSVLCGGYVVVRALFYPLEVDIERTFTPLHSLLTIGAYVQRAVVPWPPTMYYHALVYDDAGPTYPLPLLLLGVATATGAIAGLVLAWRRSKTAFWLLVSTVAFMGPLLNVYFTGLNVSAQDRFLYAPLLFGSGAIVVLFRDRFVRVGDERAASLVLVGLSLVWTGLIEIRTPDYRDDQTLWESEVRHNPSHPYVLQMLAQTAARRGDLETSYAYFARADAPDARKYRLNREPRAHFQEAVVLAAILPDGRAKELRLLLDELWRLLEPKVTPPRAIVLGFEIGAPVRDLERLAKDKAFYWDVALIATRLGDFARAEEAIRRTSERSALASASPLNDALALARIGLLADASEMAATIRQRPEELGALVSARDLHGLDERLRRSAQVAAERDRSASKAARTGLEAMRLAELGAYLAALRVLASDGTIDVPDATPLVLQLLVACRLESAARERFFVGDEASKARPEEASALISRLRSELPPRLREMAPVPGDMKSVLGALER